MFPFILGLSYISLAIGTASVVSLKVKPGAPTVLQVIFVFSALLVFIAFVFFSLYRKKQAVKEIFELRKEDDNRDNAPESGVRRNTRVSLS
jgi:hypothetical protein